MKTTKPAVLLAVCLIFLLCAGECGRNVDWVKERAAGAAEQAGFKIIGYEGYQWSIFYGGKVYYTLSRVPDNGTIYDAGFVRRPFTNEIHMGNLEAIDAIKP